MTHAQLRVQGSPTRVPGVSWHKFTVLDLPSILLMPLPWESSAASLARGLTANACGRTVLVLKSSWGGQLCYIARHVVVSNYLGKCMSSDAALQPLCFDPQPQ